jgi:hypothetical protein
MDSITTLPVESITATTMVACCTLSPIPCGLPNYVELQFRNPVNKPFDEGFLGIVLVLPLRQSSVQGEPHETISKIPKPFDKNVKVL